MNEQDLRTAFQDVVVTSSPPPAMDPNRALHVARKARSARRSSLVGAVVAVLVVGIGLGSAFALNPAGTRDYLTGAGPSSSSSRPSGSTMAWASEQPDRSASQGPQAVRAEQLLDAVKRSAWSYGYETPALKYQNTQSGNGEMMHAQAVLASDPGEQPELWQFTAYVPVRKNGKVGKLVIEVSTPGPRHASEPCALAKQFWGKSKAMCKVRNVNGLQVGDAASQEPGGVLGWMSYKHPNGWVVTVAQSAGFDGGGYPALDVEPFEGSELAAMAVDPKFANLG
ncbi:hypothetical protein [Nocardia sp. NRRL S-836]|uniref:hypothetical protein n=1 Tax=Nocardia sp. NRRL S-836 TaxID=1519492 RepID=UPI0006AF6750|nr:hypothetical protein [Nocardia sp. NRRL S-836]KOV79942.1 hypothetical protein ADL03_35190 [Nocardia sp. NRRL S-836]